MNLSLILNMPGSAAGSTLGLPAAAQAAMPPEMASFQDFLALMGLSPMAVEPGTEDLGDALPDSGALMAANDTGNFLPADIAALPVLPVLTVPPVPAASLMQTVPAQTLGTAERPTGAPVGQPKSAPLAAAAAQHSPMPLIEAAAATASAPLAQPAAPTAANPAAPAMVPTPTPGGQPQPQPLPSPAAPALEIEVVLPPATLNPAPVQAAAAQAVAQPVIAQLLQTAPRPIVRKPADEVAVPTAGPVAEAAETQRPATATPVLPVAATAAIVAPAPDQVAPQAATLTPTVAASTETPARHDFAAVIDKLSEARELARPGRADMHLMHREFGQVSVQFELAGQALKVAMTSNDAAFAPAVQAALAERPITPVADAARADANAPRADTVTAANASWQAGPQADGQRGEGQRQARPGQPQVLAQHNDGDAAARQSGADRDGSRFA